MKGEGRSQSEYVEMIRANKVKESTVIKDMVIGILYNINI